MTRFNACSADRLGLIKDLALVAAEAFFPLPINCHVLPYYAHPAISDIFPTHV